jgi:adenylate cyclase class 2
MATILQQLPRSTTAYQENKRTTYQYGEVEICIDSRPKIPTYLEIEGPNVEAVEQMLKLLGLAGKDVGDMGVIEVYEKYGLHLHSYNILTF